MFGILDLIYIVIRVFLVYIDLRDKGKEDTLYPTNTPSCLTPVDSILLLRLLTNNSRKIHERWMKSKIEELLGDFIVTMRKLSFIKLEISISPLMVLKSDRFSSRT